MSTPSKSSVKLILNCYHPDKFRLFFMYYLQSLTFISSKYFPIMAHKPPQSVNYFLVYVIFVLPTFVTEFSFIFVIHFLVFFNKSITRLI